MRRRNLANISQHRQHSGRLIHIVVTSTIEAKPSDATASGLQGQRDLMARRLAWVRCDRGLNLYDSIYLPFLALSCEHWAVIPHIALSVKDTTQGSRRLHTLLLYMVQAAQASDWRNDLSPTFSCYPTFSDRLKKRQELRAAHIRKANIEARLAAAHVRSIPLDWGYVAIANALELDTVVLDFEIPATREWIEFMGKELYQGQVGKGKLGFEQEEVVKCEDEKRSLSRWEFW